MLVRGSLGILSHLGILSPIPFRMTGVTLPHTVTSHYKEIKGPYVQILWSLSVNESTPMHLVECGTATSGSIPQNNLIAIKPLTNLTPPPPPSGAYQKFPD